ncbi:hypothetical protein EPI10_031581 [Gossypium australe]|uniref:Gag-asp_proteas domain-containing protein n=1 Tax=Gossypium australe TaxID=47621 RepID=A0A5B6X450_9ROSI|nr:hypothetical protein EPI10_031581 [Gossypium australe]
MPTEDPHLQLRLFMESLSLVKLVATHFNYNMARVGRALRIEVLPSSKNGAFEWHIVNLRSTRPETSASVSSISSMLKNFTANEFNTVAIQPPNQFENIACVYSGEGHLIKNCPSNPESVYYMGSQNQNKGKEHCKVVTLRSGRTLKPNTVEAEEEPADAQDKVEDILFKNRRLGEFETVALTKECSAFLQDKLPLKMKDPGCFTITCNIGASYCGKALCDLGASMNLMPLSVFGKLGIGEVRPTTVTLHLADISLAHPEGKI